MPTRNPGIALSTPLKIFWRHQAASLRGARASAWQGSLQRWRVRFFAIIGLCLCFGAVTTADAKLTPTIGFAVSPAYTNVYNAQLTFFMRIAPPSSGDPNPTGAIEIQRYPTSDFLFSVICENSAIDPNLPTQTCTVHSPGPDVPVGVWHFRAVYHGDDNYEATSAFYEADNATETDYTITKAAVHLTVEPVQSIYYGQPPIFVVNTTGGYQPTGLISIDFNYTGGLTNVQCDAQANPVTGSNSSATCIGSNQITAGTYPVTAYYGGDANHFATQVSDNFVGLAVSSSPVLLSVVPSPASVSLGASTTVQVTSTSLFGTPVVGNFSVTDGEVNCSFTMASNGLPNSCVLTPISAGQKTLTATYQGYPDYYTPSTASAALSVVAAPINGVCGSDDGQILASTPKNLCSAGTPSAVSGSGPWTWTCVGLNAGTTDACSANLAKSYTVTPSASANGNISPNTAQPVVSGATKTFTVTPDSGYNATVGGTCDGSSSGMTYTTHAITADCTVIASFTAIQAPVNGVCGSDNGAILTRTPTNLCNEGTPSAVSGNGPWAWTCAGIDGGTTASCAAQTRTPTTLSISASPNPVTVGQTVTATVVVGGTAPTSLAKAVTTVIPAAAGGGVTVSAGGTNCTASLVNGSGACALSFAAAGTYTITASYAGDAVYAASSATINEVVLAAATSTDMLRPAPSLDRWALLLLTLSLCGVALRRRGS